jgi:hypothetical protein
MANVPTPRSTNRRANAPKAGMRPLSTSTVTIGTVTANTCTTVTIALPRSFKPNYPLEVVFETQDLDSGLSVGSARVSGNAPSCSGCSPNHYQATIEICNVTTSNIAATAQLISLYQA